MSPIHAFKTYPSALASAGAAILFLLVGLVSTPAFAGEQLVLVGDSVISRSPLPDGAPESEVQPLSTEIEELTYLDDGRRVGIRKVIQDRTLLGQALVEVQRDGTVVDLGMLERVYSPIVADEIRDLAVDSEGRLYVLAFTHVFFRPPFGWASIRQLDPEDGSTLSIVYPGKMPRIIARAPEGFWTWTWDGLELVDPETGTYTPVRDDDQIYPRDGATDSSGILWLYTEEVCSPTSRCSYLHRFDPVTGELTDASPDLNPAELLVRDLAIQPRCKDSETALCLQGGRFRAEVEWQNADGATGRGKLTPARSADSGIFWLFDPANWELNVKVLDGCALNGHFWVFASGSTDVGLTLTVTDLETDDSKIYLNPQGRTMATVTDTAAFSCE